MTSYKIIRFKPLWKNEYNLMVEKFKNGVKLNLYNSCLTSMNENTSEHLLDLTLIFNEMPNYYGFVQVFAGAGAPIVNNSFKTIDQGTIRIHYKFDDSNYYQSYVPLSASFNDTCYHQLKINHDIISIIKKAAGNKGTFSLRKSSYHNGFLSYIGKRSRSSQSQPNPSEGPRNCLEPHGLWYYRNTINPIYWPKTLHIFNHIATSASNVAYYIYKYLQCFYNHRTNSQDIFFCRLMIATINFLCTPHCDEKDVLNSNKTEDIIQKCEKVKSNDESNILKSEGNVECVINNLQFWGVCGPTSCCYQIVQCHTNKQVNVIQYFCLPNFGLCY